MSSGQPQVLLRTYQQGKGAGGIAAANAPSLSSSASVSEARLGGLGPCPDLEVLDHLLDGQA
ncbi:MAG: hypothetical protein WAR61_01630, partial [Candidatus Microthrix parvicella]